MAGTETDEEMKNSYLDYAMSVIVGRALPDVRDGLKPVHRRSLYAMYDLSNFHNKPFKKSANVVGTALARYHPHGDIAVYDKTSSNIAGHIGVALGGGTVSYFRCFEQNSPVGTNALVRFRDYNTPKLLGVLRPKVNITPPVTDQSKYDFGEGFGVQELQAARSIMQDQKRNITDLNSKIVQIKTIVG